MYSKTIIVGRVGGEVKMFGDGKVASFSVAVDCGYGEKKRTEWYNVKAFGKTAGICEKFVGKGSILVVEGQLETNERDGKRYVSLNADRVQFLPGGTRKGGEEQASKPAADDGDLPF